MSATTVGALPRHVLHVRVALPVVALAVLLYATGFGPALVVVLLLPATAAIRTAGVRSARYGLGWAAATVLAGQLATVVGLAPSRLDHLAGTALAGLGLTTLLLAGVRMLLLAETLGAAARQLAGARARPATAARTSAGGGDADDVADGPAPARTRELPALHDPLTRLASRALLLDRLEHTAARAGRSGGPYAVLHLDLDGFQTVNDAHGHRIGDLVLQTVADRLLDAVRGADTVARTSADEFAVLLDHGSTPVDAAKVAQRMLAAVRLPIPVGGRRLQLSASIGIAHAEPDTDAAEVLRNAAIAMHLARQGGGDRFEVFETSMHVRVVERLELESDLARAVEHGELEVHYQPIVRLADRRIVGFEALVRWPHPTRGSVQPSRFVPLAEQSDLIAPLGRLVLGEAGRQLARWREELPGAQALVVSVNVSVHQLTRGDLAADVAAVLHEAGLPPTP